MTASATAARLGRHLFLLSLGFRFRFPGFLALLAHLTLFRALGDVESRRAFHFAATTRGSGTACLVGTDRAGRFAASAAGGLQLAWHDSPDRGNQGRNSQARKNLFQLIWIHRQAPLTMR